MTHLSETQLADLRDELARQLQRLRRSMRASDEALRPVELDQTTVGRLSRIEALQNQGLAKNLHEREEVRLALVERALARMESGTYGLCTECGGPLPFERLFVFPEAATCAACP